MNILKTKFLQHRKLKTDIFVVFSALLFAFVVFITLYSVDANKKIVLRFEKDYYSNKISSMTANWLDSYFSQVELVANVLSKNKLFLDGTESRNFADFEALFKGALKRTPFALTFQLTLNNGAMLQVRNIKGLKSFQKDSTHSLPTYATYAIRKMEHLGKDSISESWEYLDSDFSPIVRENLKTARYDPRERSWYFNAATNKKLVWSEPYVFKTSRELGITISSPILQEGNKKVLGVISVDFSLNDFGDLLNKVKSTANSCVRLINDKNEILASTVDSEKLAKHEDAEKTTGKLVKVTEVKDEILKIAAKNLIGTNETHTTYKTSSGRAFVASKSKLNSVPFSILIITPQSDFTEDFERIQTKMFVLSFFIFLVSAGIVFLFSRRISEPILQLCKSATAIGKIDLDNYPGTPESGIFEIKELSSTFERMKESVSAFAKYTPKGLIHDALKNGEYANVGGMTREVTMFFSDIEKFSTVSEKLPAEYLICHLSEYFDELTQSILKHHGTIDKYIGDSIMAIWGAQNSDENQAIDACETALDCQQILAQLKGKWISLGKPPLPTRIGLHSGSAVVGNIGSQDRMDFTAIGNTVDTASSLEGANKVYGTWILASESVEGKARNKILFRVIDKIAVNGSNTGVTIYEPLCSLKNANEMYYRMLELCSKSKEAFELYQKQNFKDALKLYTEIQTIFPEKMASIRVLLNRCEEFLAKPPKNWDGVYRLG